MRPSFRLALKRTRPLIGTMSCALPVPIRHMTVYSCRAFCFGIKIGHISTAYLVYISNSAGSNIVHDSCINLNHYMHTQYSHV